MGKVSETIYEKVNWATYLQRKDSTYIWSKIAYYSVSFQWPSSLEQNGSEYKAWRIYSTRNMKSAFLLHS